MRASSTLPQSFNAMEIKTKKLEIEMTEKERKLKQKRDKAREKE
jgi:hypothetical protein